jgi:hypothetical protein
MRVSVRQQGGVLGIDQTVEVDEATLADDEAAAFRGLASKCAGVIVAAPAKAPAGTSYDSMTTTVEIDDDGTTHAITVQSGDDVPAPVTALIKAVTESGSAG